MMSILFILHVDTFSPSVFLVDFPGRELSEEQQLATTDVQKHEWYAEKKYYEEKNSVCSLHETKQSMEEES